jgi:hypothetical protein
MAAPCSANAGTVALTHAIVSAESGFGIHQFTSFEKSA